MQLRRRKKLSSNISLISMADIAFLLIIFFVCVAAADMDSDRDIALPAIPHTETIEAPHRLNVYVDKDGDLRISRQGYSLDDAELYLLQRMRFDPETIIFFNSDERCAFARTEDALGVLRRAGALRIVFVSREGLSNDEF